ncbi:glycoside hydrolase family 9 protein [Dyadobacter sp. CY261]|uniref:glycoside hydrolase family 9 protein n=1 Tax=Dyadobacter sp. CY261 TaxID=2907203 RepID=UPI001F405187|nr:glycoside hydrolase family 9 protein [Dyadobacter sp. CY261]MCF0069605.1 glycoside hydrolase family 9 protein [Dyadobacter sp. CY261]
MKRTRALLAPILLVISLTTSTFAKIIIHINQVGFDTRAIKSAVVASDAGELDAVSAFDVIDVSNQQKVFSGKSGRPEKIEEWFPGRIYQPIDFSGLTTSGRYKIVINAKGMPITSDEFQIGDKAVAKLLIPSIIHYYNKQRADKPEELLADEHVTLYGGDKTVDLRGGWDDASGDISKYFSHLAYANFMSQQQIPLCTWAMTNAAERIPGLLTNLNVLDSMKREALYGADYIVRSLSEEGYFYMTIFSYFNPDPKARRVVGLNANSVTTDKYQCAYREGGGMGVAALARISRWKMDGAFTSAQYLAAAKRAFAHLQVNNLKYCDDGKENVLDDYCALMGATELWLATGENEYRDEARKRAKNLGNRLAPAGYFIANDANRPFWHASDAGLPIVALCRYLDAEQDATFRKATLSTIKKALDYNVRVTGEVANPFGYARQSFLLNGAVKDGFFIPHENESGWWWQGENARLGSLASAALLGGRLVYPASGGLGTSEVLSAYAGRQISWILGGNPYEACFMYGYGRNNMPYMKSMYGHGSERGGISNGVTGKDGNADGSGIDYKPHDNGNEWRWTEQWIPHAAWFLIAVTTMAQE